MESNWRFNVWKYGLSSLWEFAQPGLVAGVPPDPPANVLYTNVLHPLGGRLQVYLPDVVVPDEYFFVNGAFGSRPHFPYGFTVEPDHA